MAHSINQVVIKGYIVEATKNFGVSRRTVQNIWATTKQQINEGNPVYLTSKKFGSSRKTRQLHLDCEKIRSIAYPKRGNIRSLSHELEVSKSTVGRWVKSGVIRAHINSIKPSLTDKNKLQRMSFTLSALIVQSEPRAVKFSNMYDVVHIDEWFYMARDSERYYVLPEEDDPYRSCKSKRFISKIMFMCAVARPRVISDGNEFDGKIGIWPFTTQEPATRNSKHRPRGTLVTKPIDSITKEVIKNCIINQVIPAIKAKWPSNASKTIYIQQDNARPHISNEDPEFRVAASADGFDIQLIFQPPNSPDTNINDLGWFRAIQFLQVDTTSYSVEELVHNVLLSFQRLNAITLNNVFLSLQCCLIEVMKVKGHNNYKIPHMGKKRLNREGRLPISLSVEEGLVIECLSVLREYGNPEGVTYQFGTLIRDLGL